MWFKSRPLLVVAFGALLVAVVHATVVAVLVNPLPEDDAFITYHYAENLVRGEGLVFNPGERVLGTTAPLYALWLAGLRAVTGGSHFVAWALRSNLVWLLASAALLGLLVWRLTEARALAVLASAWVLLLPQSLALAFGGMEVWFFQALALAALLLFHLERRAAAVALGCLAALARPEGLILVAVLVIASALMDRRSLPKVLGFGLAPLVVWTAWSTWYYGSPVPSSVLAKASLAAGNPTGTAGHRLLAELGATLLGGPSGLAGELLTLGVTVLAAAWVGVLGGRRGVLTDRLAAVWLTALLVAFSIGNPAWYPWYAGVVLGPWLLVLVLGWSAAAQRAGRSSFAAALLLLLVATQLIGAARALHAPGWPETAAGAATPYRFRVLAYAQAARELNRRLAPGSTLLANEVGALGYLYRRGPVLDGLSLVSPEARPYVAALRRQGYPRNMLSPALVRTTRPAAVVAFPRYLTLLEEDAEFEDDYALVGRFEAPGRHDRGYAAEVFVRRRQSR